MKIVMYISDMSYWDGLTRGEVYEVVAEEQRSDGIAYVVPNDLGAFSTMSPSKFKLVKDGEVSPFRLLEVKMELEMSHLKKLEAQEQQIKENMDASFRKFQQLEYELRKLRGELNETLRLESAT